MKKYRYSIGMFLFSLIAMAQDCPPDVTVTDPIDETGVIIQAVNTLTASNTIQSGASVTYRAGDSITFIPGFDAVSGAALDALIEVCVPNDPLFYLQWGHYNTGQVPVYEEGIPIDQRPLIGEPDADADILEAWEITTGSPDITVALLDSGIAIDHPDLYHPDPDSLRIVEGYNFLSGGDPTDVNDTLGHGTLVAGILGAIANNGMGVAGVDQQCKIMPLKVVDDSGSNIDPNNIAKAIQHAITHDANIISMSLGYRLKSQFEIAEKTLRDAIDAGLLIFAAAGNDNDTLDYPARYASVVGVGAMSPCNTRKRSINDPEGVSCDQDNRPDGNDVLHWGSNYGEGLDFVAPGTLLPSTDVLGVAGSSNSPLYQSVENGDYILDTYGTSMSSPFAAGVAALVWSVNPDLKHYQVRYILQDTAVDIGDPTTGHGSINARAAVEMAQTFDPNSDFLLANLTLEMVGVPVVVNSGQDIAITYRVINTGDTPAASASTLTYYLTKISSNGFNDNNPIGGVTVDTIVPALNPGALFEDTITIPISSLGCDKGYTNIKSYAINFKVDVNDDVEEFNEFNHFKEILQPDLIVANEALTPSKGGGYLFTYDVKNVGTGKAYLMPELGQSYQFYEYYASDNDELDIVQDSLVGSENVTILNNFILCPQDSISKQANLDIPVGTNYLLIRIDATEEIGESDEDNVFAINLMPAIDPIEDSIGIDPVEDPVAYAKAENNTVTEEIAADNDRVLFNIYPVPVKNNAVIKLVFKEDRQQLNATLYAMNGRAVRQLISNKNYPKGSYEETVDLSGVSPGVYMLVVATAQHRFSKLVVVE